MRAVALPDICRVEHLADQTGLAPSTIRRALREGRLPGRRVGRRWLIPRPALLAWLSSVPGGTGALQPRILRVVRGGGEP